MRTEPLSDGLILGPAAAPPLDFAPFDIDEVQQSLPDRFEKIVRQHGDRTVIKTGDRRVSYAELNAMANRMARSIAARLGEKPEPVALLLTKSAALLAAMLGVLKAGKFFVPLDPALPKARIAEALEDCGAGLVITDGPSAELARQVARGGALVEFESVDDGNSHEDLRLPISPQALAYLIYTSGSTGRAKGVVHSHRSLLHNIMLRTNAMPIRVDDRVALLPIGTASAVTHTFYALLNGAALLPFDVRIEGVARLGSWLSAESISVLWISAPLFRSLCATMTGSEGFSALRLLRLTSESVYKTDVDLYRKYFSSDCVLVNGLHSSETGPLRFFFVDHDTEIDGDDVPVGYPVADKEVLLLDDDGRPVGTSRVGEIVVRSKYLAGGYWNRPDLTAAKFKSDPLDSESQLYFTGDLGLMLPDGCLVHKGRKDLRVKVRGYGVDVSEVEMALHRHPGVGEVAVVARQNDFGESQLVAYFTARNQPGPGISELRDHLRNQLADYMVPSYVVPLETFPLTSNGKVDRKALPPPGDLRPKLDSVYVAPATPVEEKLVRIWEEVLGIRPIGIDDDFFDLGGHSLLGARVVAQTHRELKVDLPLRALFESPTIAGLAALVRPDQARGSRPEHKAWDYLWELQGGGDRKPVFVFPGGGGGDPEFFVHARLARHVGSQYPFYGLRARGADGLAAPHRSVENMAADYLTEIRTLQPQGPYYLVGECFGGVVAYEAARQLRARGQRVALLALMDTTRPTKRSYAAYRLRMVFQPVRHNYVIYKTFVHAKRLWKRPPSQWLGYALGKAGRAFASCSRWLTHDHPSRIHAASVLRTVTHQQDLEYLHKIRDVYRLRLREHDPKPYEGRIHLFVNEQWCRRDPELGWSDLAKGGLEIHELPGNHATYIRDHVAVTAELLRKCLLTSEGE